MSLNITNGLLSGISCTAISTLAMTYKISQAHTSTTLSPIEVATNCNLSTHLNAHWRCEMRICRSVSPSSCKARYSAIGSEAHYHDHCTSHHGWKLGSFQGSVGVRTITSQRSILSYPVHVADSWCSAPPIICGSASRAITSSRRQEITMTS
jgi:hypothetical protein